MNIHLLLKQKKMLVSAIVRKNRLIFCPYFNKNIIINSDGLHHLRYSSRRERPKKEQLLRLSLVSIGLSIIKKSGTLQEYRIFNSQKITEYWAFIAICQYGNQEYGQRIKIILKRTGNGNIIFWSVMKLNNKQKTPRN